MKQGNDVYDFAIIGGGAAGLWVLRGLQDKRVLIIEGNGRLGAKLLASGGGKCNFTNRFLAPENFVCSNPHFIKSFLAKFTTQDVLDFIDLHNIPYEERDNGKLFTLSGAKSIVQALLDEGKSENYHFELNCLVQDVEKISEKNLKSELDGGVDEVFCIKTSKGDFFAQKVIVASGGLSYPKLGATNIASKVAKNFGIKVQPMVPALAGLRYPEDVKIDFASLTGIAITAEIKIKTSGSRTVGFKDQLLFTHRGFSGPLALNASLFISGATEVRFNFAPDLDVVALIQENRSNKKSLLNILSEYLPKSLVKTLLQGKEFNLSQIKKTEVQALGGVFNTHTMVITQVDGYDRAEVTRGGISVDEIFPKTMESRKCPGLYFIGEALDVTGILGGYNIHWAWASAQMLLSGVRGLNCPIFYTNIIKAI